MRKHSEHDCADQSGSMPDEGSSAIRMVPSKAYGDFGRGHLDVEVPQTYTEIFTIRPLTGRRLELTNLLIRHDRQLQGRGKRAVEALKKWAEANGFKSIHLESLTDAIGFWEKQGFAKTGARASEADWTRMRLDLGWISFELRRAALPQLS